MKTLPLFPLPVVLFPGALLPLQIFELRYRRLVKESLADHAAFVVVQSREAVHGDHHFYPLGTTATIIDWQPLPNQMIAIEVQGQQRVSVTDITQDSDGLLHGHSEPLVDSSTMSDAQWARYLAICTHLQQHSLLSFDASQIRVATAEAFSFQLASLLPFSSVSKQRLLAIDSPLERLELIDTLLKEF
ncbi:LON peptidase substrate-binding domain-containing protein [Amphritea sp. 1_MG-2023]|uniref:LON peptidase substrate-binding domain-containing protein n=1 Tax=Amphritea sp. 1_MG-2023 TaxID=3062670 RepID=UPI0026E39C2B|nr:LON peptidase substrate-binding domain-containing protein [Amphritea sp. 1_MG-2023]MDO6562112.1 LON peptidase substrate-binding domain-containing protein [Amphritea sp. 1_MG-2023]